MAGIRALSATVKMTEAETEATGLTKAGFARDEEVALSVTPAFTSYSWSMTRPTGSSAARSAMSSTSVATPSFRPDINGEFILTCTDGTTTYDLVVEVSTVAPAEVATHTRRSAMLPDQIPITSGGGTEFLNAETGLMSVKYDDGSVQALEGRSLRHGAAAPTSGVGSDGDTYLRLDPDTLAQDGKLFVKAAGAWAEDADARLASYAQMVASLAEGMPPPPDVSGSVLVDQGGALGRTDRRLTLDDIDAAFAISTWVRVGGVYTARRGDTISTVTATASYTSTPASASVANSYGGSSDPGDVNGGAWTLLTPFTSASMAGTVKRSGADLGADPTWTATLTATGATVKTSPWTVTFTSNILYGVGAAGLDTQGELEAALTSVLQAAIPASFTVSPSNQYVYVAWPKGRGTASYTLNGFPAAFEAPFDVSFTNVNAVVETYSVMRSTNLLTGSGLVFVRA